VAAVARPQLARKQLYAAPVVSVKLKQMLYAGPGVGVVIDDNNSNILRCHFVWKLACEDQSSTRIAELARKAQT
jgi:hypothetical protein